MTSQNLRPMSTKLFLKRTSPMFNELQGDENDGGILKYKRANISSLKNYC